MPYWDTEISGGNGSFAMTWMATQSSQPDRGAAAAGDQPPADSCPRSPLTTSVHDGHSPAGVRCSPAASTARTIARVTTSAPAAVICR